MIRVIKDWVIDGNEAGGYIVGKANVRLNKQKGANEEFISNQKYLPDVKGCLNYILRTEQKELVLKNNMSITEAIDKFAEMQKDFAKLLEVVKESI